MFTRWLFFMLKKRPAHRISFVRAIAPLKCDLYLCFLYTSQITFKWKLLNGHWLYCVQNEPKYWPFLIVFCLCPNMSFEYCIGSFPFFWCSKSGLFFCRIMWMAYFLDVWIAYVKHILWRQSMHYRYAYPILQNIDHYQRIVYCFYVPLLYLNIVVVWEYSYQNTTCFVW